MEKLLSGTPDAGRWLRANVAVTAACLSIVSAAAGGVITGATRILAAQDALHALQIDVRRLTDDSERRVSELAATDKEFRTRLDDLYDQRITWRTATTERFAAIDRRVVLLEAFREGASRKR